MLNNENRISLYGNEHIFVANYLFYPLDAPPFFEEGVEASKKEC